MHSASAASPAAPAASVPAFLPAAPLPASAHPLRRRPRTRPAAPAPPPGVRVAVLPRRYVLTAVHPTYAPPVTPGRPAAAPPPPSIPVPRAPPPRPRARPDRPVRRALCSLSAAAAVLSALLPGPAAAASSAPRRDVCAPAAIAASVDPLRAPRARPDAALAVQLAPDGLTGRVARARRGAHALRERVRAALQPGAAGAVSAGGSAASAGATDTAGEAAVADEAGEQSAPGNGHGSHSGAVHDALVLLLTTVVIIPLACRLGISPILGFLAAGVALGPNGLALINDVAMSKALAELGVVFFLFEMGLELSTSKLKSLGADVFGLGTTQFLATGAVMTAVASLCGVSSQAAIVLGAGLALSSSAFVLQLLNERGEVGTRFGRAAFGILLFQDLAVVPVLVLTPLLAGSGGVGAVMQAISIASAKAAVALAFIFFMGKNFLQPVFRFVARARSSEAFIAIILLTVLGTSSLTQMLGLSDTLGAFLAGVMLAETKFRHQVEADIKPFRGLLLGLFFITVGFSIDLNLAFANLGIVTAMVGGLLFAKAAIIAAAGVGFGLSLGSALRTGLLLSQGGEFAFVVFGLATSVGVLRGDVSQLMLLVVAVSMALTPALASLGRLISAALEKKRGLIGVRMEDADTADARDFVMVAGYGRVGQAVCEMLDAKLVRYMAFDMSPTRVIDARNKGLPVFFGDARRPEVLRSAGASRARAVVVTLDDPEQALLAVQNIRREFEDVRVFCRARDGRHQTLLQAAGATAIVPELLEASLLLGGAVLLDYGTPMEEVNALVEEGRVAHLVELGMSDNATATLGSSFRQLFKLQDEAQGGGDGGGERVVDDDTGNAATVDDDDDTGNAAPVVVPPEVQDVKGLAMEKEGGEKGSGAGDAMTQAAAKVVEGLEGLQAPREAGGDEAGDGNVGRLRGA